MMGHKKLLSRFGLIFLVGFVVGFLLLTSTFSKFHFNTFPGDILVERENYTLYLPFTSSTAIALFTIIVIEIIKNFKK